MTENEIARYAVDVAFKAHTAFGPGLLESVYERVMAHELQKRGLRVRRQQGIPVVYEKLGLLINFNVELSRMVSLESSMG